MERIIEIVRGDDHEKEVLRKQLDLLAEKSVVIAHLAGHESDLPAYTNAMCEIVKLLQQWSE